MHTAGLIGIDEKELRGFLIALPGLYNSKTMVYESGIELILSKFVDCEKKANGHTSFQSLTRYHDHLHRVPQRGGSSYI